MRSAGREGFTEERLALYVLGGWLAAFSVFALLRRGFALVLVPTSLFVVVLLGTFGPWSVFAFSLRDQLARFRETARTAGILSPEGKLERATREIPLALRNELSQIAVYLATSHGKDVFAGFLPDDVRERAIRTMQPHKPGGTPVTQGPEDAVQEAWKELGITYVSRWSLRDARTATLRRTDPLALAGAPIPVTGFDFATRLELRDSRSDDATMRMSLGSEGRVALPKDFSPMEIVFQGQEFAVPLTGLKACLDADPDIWLGAAPTPGSEAASQDAFDVTGTSNGWRYLLRVQEIRARKSSEGERIEYLDGTLLLDAP